MEICLKEYNAVPDLNERNQVEIVIIDSDIVQLVVHNNELIKDFNKRRKIITICNKYKPVILELKEEKYQNYKGGRQKELIVELDGERIRLSGNTDNKKVDEFYNEFKKEIVEIING